MLTPEASFRRFYFLHVSTCFLPQKPEKSRGGEDGKNKITSALIHGPKKNQEE